jgi:hypothetical protein
MKFAAMSIVYNEEKLIQGCINTWKPFIDKHVVMVSVKPFHGEVEPQDGTVEICRSNNVITFQGWWSEEHKMRNTAVALLKDYDYILINDADMWMTGEDVKKMIKEIEETNEDAYVIPQKSYWYDTNHCLVGDSFMPVIAIKPHVRFVHIGTIDRGVRVLSSAVCHHLNWCKPKNILKKVKTYAHANEMVEVDKWYKEHFLGWSEGKKAVMPIQNRIQSSFDVRNSPLPNELQEWLPK